MVVLGGMAVSYERGTPEGITTPFSVGCPTNGALCLKPVASLGRMKCKLSDNLQAKRLQPETPAPVVGLALRGKLQLLFLFLLPSSLELSDTQVYEP